MKLRKYMLLAIAVICGLATATMAEPLAADSEVLANTLKALKTKCFRAVLVLAGARRGKIWDIPKFTIYRLPDNRIRLEPIGGKAERDWYLLEDPRQTIRVEVSSKCAFVVPGKRVSYLLHAVERFLEAGRHSQPPKLEQVTIKGERFYRVSFHELPYGSVRLQLLIDGKNFLPKEIKLLTRDNAPSIAVSFENIEVKSPSDFDSGVFEVPAGYKTFGIGRKRTPAEEERLKNLRLKLSLPRNPLAGQMGGSSQLAGGDFLPLTPTYLPEGFILLSADPVFFEDKLVFHLKAIHPEKLTLISIFESTDLGPIEQAKKRVKTDGFNIFAVERKDGIAVLVLSDDVSEEELSKIGNSLQEDQEQAVELLEASL